MPPILVYTRAAAAPPSLASVLPKAANRLGLVAPALRLPGRMRRLALVQGLYFLSTGLWPLVSIRSFEAVTGPKVDRWLVKTVGVLIAVIGGVLALSGRRGVPSVDARRLAVGSAAGLTGVDVVYVARRRISPIYLLDALLEVALVVAWLAVRPATSRAPAGRGAEDEVDGPTQ
jgi:hypothetical protein